MVKAIKEIKNMVKNSNFLVDFISRIYHKFTSSNGEINFFKGNREVFSFPVFIYITI